jgi:hypothetical protein
MEMEISIGDYKLLYSGIIIQIKDHPIKIKIPDEIEGDFTFILKFSLDKVNPESIFKSTVIDKFTAQLDFINCDGFIGGGNTELINLGTLRHFPLYLNYRIFDLQPTGKSLIYNFYLGKEVENGK